MAKIKFPSYIKEGHGRMDDAILVMRKGYSYMKTYKTYTTGHTEEQLEIRNAFSTVVADWKYLGGIISGAWTIAAKDTAGTGYNAFLGSNIQHRRAGEPLELCIGMGEEILMNFTAAPGTTAGERGKAYSS